MNPARRRSGRLSAACLAAGVIVPATAAAASLTVETGLRSHQLRERAADGRVLVRETAWAPAVALHVDAGPDDPASSRWRWWLRAEAWAAEARYDGRSQGGTPVDSRTDTLSGSIEAAVAPAVGAGVAIEAGLRIERLSRRIQGVGRYAGLDERTTQPLAFVGVHWTGAATQAWVQASQGAGGPLSVRFDAGLADDVRLRTGAARGWSAGIAHAPSARWRLSAQVGRLDLGASEPAPLTSGGRPFGTVTQPRWVIDRLQVQVGRTFD